VRRAAIAAANKAAKKHGKTAKGGSAPVPPPTTKTPKEAALWQFVTRRWTDIDHILDLEEAAAQKRLEADTLMSDLVRKLITLVPGILYSDIRGCMKIYSTRNDVSHSHIGELARTGMLTDLTNKLRVDLAALNYERTITEEERVATQASIWYNIGLYFEEFDYNEVTNQVTRYAPWPQDPDGRFVRSGKRPAPRVTAATEESDDENQTEDEDTVIIYSVSPEPLGGDVLPDPGEVIPPARPTVYGGCSEGLEG
jgi:hypothetical protein